MLLIHQIVARSWRICKNIYKSSFTLVKSNSLKILLPSYKLESINKKVNKQENEHQVSGTAIKSIEVNINCTI